ncbi:Asp23/Gls24 family envelope stress response protein [Angelakisella massiliensis]|uniref:Asp23/Gls24 family envelope stress response protein n=1 Tax=Angelakisella massiliensis TaxID=1871018 RepID=UPI0009F3F034|nr:Asp23/Gls24 family envelope stress response protein [Angelakisella massiliensis]
MQDIKMDRSTAGSLKISHDVLASVAGYTVTEMEGVASLAPMSSNLTGWLLEKQTMKPISIDITDGVATIDIRIIVKNGAKIPELSKRLQSAVKEAVQNMTGIVVSKVNLYIAGIEFEETPAV